ncbi:MAG: hypothetical protein LC676_03540 [Loktanella sp.]|nr:hypothetical protein [Loktanella sp.]
MTVPDIFFHIGAHKTATTHLQRSIGNHRESLRDRGVAFFGPRDLRDAHPTLGQRFGIAPNAGRQVTPLQAMAERDKMLDGASRLVLSEENFIGGINNKWGRMSVPLYRNAQARLTDLTTKIAPQGMTLALGVRHPAALASSAYVQHLMAGGRTGLRRLQPHLDVMAIDWVDLLQRLSGVAGVSRLYVWRHEDYDRVFDQITRLLLGDAAEGIDPVEGRVHMGLSHAAVAHINANLREPDIVATARARFPICDTHPPFSIFGAAEIEKGGRLYDAQVQRIADLPKITLLTPMPSRT